MSLKDINGRDIPATREHYFAREKFYSYADGTVKFKCGNPNPNAVLADDTWECWKFVWSGGNVTDKEGPLFSFMAATAGVSMFKAPNAFPAMDGTNNFCDISGSGASVYSLL